MLATYATRPGKGIRGCLVIAGYESATGKQADALCIQAAIAVELMHAYLLIVDDVMDLSSLRRGEPTVHELYASDGEQRSQHESYMLAITVGLIVQHIANLLILQAEAGSGRKNALLTVMHQNIALTGFGQWADLRQQVGRSFAEQDVLDKYTLKSSLYTFVNPLELAYVLASGELAADVRAQIRAFGLPAGVAFQLHDDELGIFGDSGQTGKANYDDMREGKYTLMVAHALDNASEAESKDLRSILGNQTSGATELERLRGILLRTGAREYAQQVKSSSMAQAGSALDHMVCFPEDFRQTVKDLLVYSGERKS